MNVLLFAAIGVCFACNSAAGELPLGASTNQVCPAPALLPRIQRQYEACLRKQPNACASFVDTFRKLLPEYDCQRPFDATPRNNYIVSAIWLAEPDRPEKYIALLARLKSNEARRLFGSREFRSMLDGYVAEMFYEKSVEVEKGLQRRDRQSN